MMGNGFLRRVILSAALAAGLMIAAGAPAFASPDRDRDWAQDCRRRLEDARLRLDRDATRYGERSGKVERDRDRLEDARRWCRQHRADWDHDRFDFGVYIRK
jgi:hypothetical protein